MFWCVETPALTLRACWGVGSGLFVGVISLIRVSLCSSKIVLCRLFSILLSYISRRSKTLSFAKSFSAIRPRVRLGFGSDVSG